MGKPEKEQGSGSLPGYGFLQHRHGCPAPQEGEEAEGQAE